MRQQRCHSPGVPVLRPRLVMFLIAALALASTTTDRHSVGAFITSHLVLPSTGMGAVAGHGGGGSAYGRASHSSYSSRRAISSSRGGATSTSNPRRPPLPLTYSYETPRMSSSSLGQQDGAATRGLPGDLTGGSSSSSIRSRSRSGSSGSSSKQEQGEEEVLPELNHDEVRRYSRHLILPEVGVTGQRILKASSVLAVGTGGLGSPALLYLAAAGVGRLGLVDDDVVDESNLQRQVGKHCLETCRECSKNNSNSYLVPYHVRAR